MEQYHITGYYLPRVDHFRNAGSDRRALRGGKFLQGLKNVFCLIFLKKADNSIYDQDERNDERVHDGTKEERDHGCDNQNIDQRAFELPEEHKELVRLFPLRKFVRANRRETFGSFSLSKPLRT